MSTCFRCGIVTNVPFEKRKPCQCGSVSWYMGERPTPIWQAATTPPFLAISTEAYEASQKLTLLTDTAQKN